MSKVTITAPMPSYEITREVEAKPEGQKFAVGEEVYIRPIHESHMNHFSSDLITKVKYGYNQAFGDGGASLQYATEVASWYDEDQLMPTNGRSIEECRSACDQYFGNSHDELVIMKESSINECPIRSHLKESLGKLKLEISDYIIKGNKS